MRLVVPLFIAIFVFLPVYFRSWTINDPNIHGQSIPTSHAGLLIFKGYRPRLDFVHNFACPCKQTLALYTVLLLAGDIATNPGPDFKLSFANVRSIRNKSGSVSNFAASEKPDIFAICESWLSNNETSALLSEITPVGYTLHHLPRVRRTGGGVAVFARSHIKCCKLSTRAFGSFEHLTIQINLNNHNYNFVILYRPPNSSSAGFLDDFASFLETLYALPSNFIICGDFNIQIDSANSFSRQFLDLLDSWNLQQHISFPTHIHGHIIDLLLTPSNLDNISSVRSSDWISDHVWITATLDFSSPVAPQKELLVYRNFKDIDLDKLKDDLRRSELITAPKGSAEGLYEQFHTTLTHLLDQHAPIRHKKQIVKKACLWSNPEIVKAKQLKRQYERAYKRDKCSVNRSRLRRQINYFNRLVSKAKDAYYRDIIDNHEENPAHLWSAINRVLHRTSETILPEHICEKELADTFSTFFIDKIKKIRDGFGTVSNTCQLQPDTHPPPFSTFSSVSNDHVLKTIKRSPPKTCSLDPWPTFLILECIDLLIAPITQLINFSLHEGCFPSRLKCASITPLIKKASLPKDDLKSYRPVSGLIFISKLIERIVAQQLKHHLESNGLSNVWQSAYKSSHSTESALLRVKNDMHLSIAKGDSAALVLLDLSAAFDTIDHSFLLERLSSWFGLGSTVLQWFKSYLVGRTQKVKIGNTFSNSHVLNFGVPQGSVLGPMLFTMYTSPISKIINNYASIYHHLYADDTQIYMGLNNHNIVQSLDTLNQCLCNINKWMMENKLKLNPDKTEFLLTGTRIRRTNLSSHFPTDLLGNSLTPSDKVRNLGVVFDANLSLAQHVTAICRSCYYHIKDLCRIRRFLSKSVAIKLANALVTSRIDYCNSLFTSLSAKDLKKLQSVQNTMARIIMRLPKRSSVSAVLKELHWLPIKHRLRFKVGVLTYKALETGQPKYLSELLSPYTSVKNTRRSNPNLRLLQHFNPGHKINSGSHLSYCFQDFAPRLWNSFPLNIRTAPTLGSFRRQLKTHLFSSAFPP